MAQPEQHEWFFYERLKCDCCRKCGLIRREGMNKPCRGIVRVGPRVDPEPPPCERPVPQFEQHRHPRFPSGDCVVCGALCTEGCKHELAVGEYAPREP